MTPQKIIVFTALLLSSNVLWGWLIQTSVIRDFLIGIPDWQLFVLGAANVWLLIVLTAEATRGRDQ